MKKLIILSVFVVSCLLASETHAQKVKYKDLYPLLNSKNYTLGEPLLKTFIKNEPEHANAHFQMAMLYEYKANKTDVLKEKELLNTYIDSAVYFYKKASTMITEKEVKKNEEFYQAYNRRDLRTGKFEIKISDIQLEIEKAIKNLENRRTGAQGLNMNFDGLQRNYKASADIYNGFTEAYPDINKFFLRSNPASIEKLNQMVQLFDSVHFYQKAYTESLTGVKTTYKQSFSYEDIEKFANINTDSEDFYAPEVKLDDFGDWASKSLGVIETDITRLRKGLIDYSALITTSENDKYPVENIQDDKLALLKKYGSADFFQSLFELRKWMNLNKNMEDSLLEKMKAESSFVGEGLANVLKEGYATTESISSKLSSSDFSVICSDYEEFVSSQHKGCQQLQEYISNINNQSKLKFQKFDSIAKEMAERAKWSINGTDSLALFAGKPRTSVNQTIFVSKLANADKQLAIGIKPNAKKGSNVFIALISSILTTEWLTEIDTKGLFELTTDSQGAALMEGGYETYLGAVYSKDAKGLFNTYLVATDVTGKQKWTINHSLNFAVTKIEPSTELPGYKLYAADSTFILIDPAGKIRQ